MQTLKQKLLAVLLPLFAMFAMVASGVARAEEVGIDVSGVVTAINGNQAVLLAIGGAVLALLYLVRAFSWGRKI